jgi:hypothetical protein
VFTVSSFRFGCCALLGLWLAGAEPRHAGAADDIVGFCQQHPTLDYPNRTWFGARYEPGAVPGQVQATGASNWRCMNGKVLLCSDSADGDSCSKKNPSLTPGPFIREDCAESGSISRAVSAYSASTWRCVKKHPVIQQTYRLDSRGFMSTMWLPYVVENGKVVKPKEDDFPIPR